MIWDEILVSDITNTVDPALAQQLAVRRSNVAPSSPNQRLVTDEQMDSLTDHLARRKPPLYIYIFSCVVAFADSAEYFVVAYEPKKQMGTHDGVPSFEDETLYNQRFGMKHVLPVSNFIVAAFSARGARLTTHSVGLIS